MKSHIIGPIDSSTEVVDDDELEGMEFDEFVGEKDKEPNENN